MTKCKGCTGTGYVFDSYFTDGYMPDEHICPDCKGTGNLLDSIGTFPDTRIMRDN